jgi:hypothetical protein
MRVGLINERERIPLRAALHLIAVNVEADFSI